MPNLLKLLPILLLAVLLAPGVAQGQIVKGSSSAGPPRDQRPALPPDKFVRAAYSLTQGDYVKRVRGISDKRAPRHLYGDDGEGNLLVLAQEGVISLGPDGITYLRIPAQRLRDAGMTEPELLGAATRDGFDGALFAMNSDGDLMRIPSPTGEEIETAVEASRMEAFAGGTDVVINDLLWANNVVWIASDGPAGLMKYTPSDDTLEHIYDPIFDLEQAGTGTIDAGVKSLAHEGGRGEIVFAVGWDLGGRDGRNGRIGGVNADGELFRIATRDSDVVVDDEPLPRGLAAVGGGAYLVAQRDGAVIWFNYTPDAVRAMPFEGAKNILRSLVDDIDDEGRPEIKPLALAADCEGRAYFSLTVGIVSVREAERELVPGDFLLVAGKAEILRVTPFGEPMVFRKGGLRQGAGEEALALQTASALARSPIDGHIAVADEGAHRIFRFSPDGLKIPEFDANLPYQIGFDAEGNLYYLDRSFLVDRDNEEERRNLKSSIPSVVSRPLVGGRTVHHQFEDGDWGETAMAIRPDGGIVIAQVWQAGEPERGRVIEIDAEEEDGFRVLLELEHPRALFIDKEGDLWIGEESTESGVNGRLLRLKAGASAAELERILPREGEANPLVVPSAISETDDERLIIADRKADVYPGSTRTGGLFSVNKDGSDLRVLLDHPDFPPPSQIGVIYVPPFECKGYLDCPVPARCPESEEVCPPIEDCAEDATFCPPQEECETIKLQCPRPECRVDVGQCEIPKACKIFAPPPPPPPPTPPVSESCIDCSSGPSGTAASLGWLGSFLRR